MNLIHHYYNDTVDKFVINKAQEGERPSLTINATRISSHEFDEIEAWCQSRDNNHFYSIGVIVFANQAAMTEFLLKWS